MVAVRGVVLRIPKIRTSQYGRDGNKRLSVDLLPITQIS